MEINIKIDNINYGELVVKYLPKLEETASDDSGTAAVLRTVSHMSKSAAKAFINAFPQKTKDELVVWLIKKNKDAVIQGFNKELGVTIRNIDVKI